MALELTPTSTNVKSSRSFWLAIGFLALMMVAAVLRLWQLGQPIFAHDEVYTAFYLHGKSPKIIQKEIMAASAASGFITPRTLEPYQHLAPGRGLPQTITALIAHDPHHPPLFYASLWLWCHLFGDTFADQRLFSVLLGCLVVPAFFWLCRELFQSRVAAFIGAILVAVAPFEVSYSRENRPYAIWILAVAICCAALLYAWRTRTRGAWKLYTLTLIFALYTHLLSLLVVFAHVVYVRAMAHTRPSENSDEIAVYADSENRRHFTRSWRLALLLFIPWLLVLARYVRSSYHNTKWTATGDAANLLQRWLKNIAVQFVDVGFNVPLWVSLPSLAFAFTVLVYTWVRAPRPVRLFIFSLLGCTVLPFLIPDLLFGGSRSVAARFNVPFWVGLSLAVTYLVSQLLAARVPARRALGALGLASLVLLGIGSAMTQDPQKMAWYKGKLSEPLPPAAQFIERQPDAIVVTDALDASLGNIFAFANLLRPEQRIVIVNTPEKLQQLAQHPDQRTATLYMIAPYGEGHAEYVRSVIKQGGYTIENTPVNDLWEIRHRTNGNDANYR